jgi:serine/threonine-protein kinase
LVATFVASHISRLQAQVQSARQLGVYELEERIAQGGMGEVWRARHHLLSRPAAVKLIKPRRLNDGREVVEADAEERFEREAQITASLKSPHTVELYDFGVTETGTFYYVMELLDGFNLEELVAAQGPMEPGRVVRIMRQLLDSLSEAHQRGLVHRDIKPANISVSERGLEPDFVKVLDFGLVQAQQRPGTSTPDADRINGTPAYLAPEALTGSAPVDARTDLYAVGFVAYWMLTGQLVFEANTPTQMAVAHVVERPRRPSERLGRPFPHVLEQLVMACLAKDPSERPASALEMVSELDELIASERHSGEVSVASLRRSGFVPLHA